MPPWTDDAVCLRHWDWSETSQTAVLLTEQHGIVRVLAKGSRRHRTPYSGGLELLARADAEVISKPSGSLSLLTAWTLREIFPAATASIEGFYASLYLADLVANMLAEADPYPEVFRGVVSALRELQDHLHPALVRAQWTLVVACGFKPRMPAETESGQISRDRSAARMPGAQDERPWFDPTHGVFELGRPGTAHASWRVRRATLATLESLDHHGAHGWDHTRCNPRGILGASRFLAAYCRYLVGKEIPTFRPVYGDLDPMPHSPSSVPRSER